MLPSLYSKIFLFITYFFVFFVIFSFRSFANENFSTSYNITYTVSEDQITHALFKVNLKNKESDKFASSYKINLGFSDISNVIATDEKGEIKTVVSKNESGYSIALPFNVKVVGKDKSFSFTLFFDTKDIVKKNGLMWEINIPKIKDQQEFSEFNVLVKVPPVFDKPVYIKPEIFSSELFFTKEDLKNSGISIAFGKTQYYQFELIYHLKNSNLFPTTAEIALPPSTNYQDVAIEQISPMPKNVYEDTDGNWIATYSLSPSQNLDIFVTGKANVNIVPKKEELSIGQIELYIKEQLYWQQTEEIKKLAKSLKTPVAIYDYVVKNLTYDYSRIADNNTRVEASMILNNPTSAVCLEFTDLFIALARAAGIPAREVDGFAYSENPRQKPLSRVKDILHAWPEYYDQDKKTWIMVDPTWGKTTGGIDYFHVLDFNHIAFVKRGDKSNYPIPAGDYKVSKNKYTKDVNISFTNIFQKKTPSIVTKLFLPQSTVSVVPIEGYFELTNTENILFPKGVITVESEKLSPKKRNIGFKSIPPYGIYKIPLVFEGAPVLTNSQANVTIQISDYKVSKKIDIYPIIYSKLVIGGVIFVIFTIILSVIAAKSRGIYFSRQRK